MEDGGYQRNHQSVRGMKYKTNPDNTYGPSRDMSVSLHCCPLGNASETLKQP